MCVCVGMGGWSILAPPPPRALWQQGQKNVDDCLTGVNGVDSIFLKKFQDVGWRQTIQGFVG